jgi:hypothetical protein
MSDRETTSDATGSDAPHADVDAGPGEGKRWPAIFALVTAWTRPAETTWRTAHVSLAWAFFVHLLGILAAGFAIGVKDIWRLFGSDESLLSRLLAAPYVVIRASIHQIFAASFGEIFWAVMGAVGIEAAVLAGAVLILPFGARRETMRNSLRHALRRGWLHAGALVPPILVFCVLDGVTAPVIEDLRYKAETACEAQFPTTGWTSSAPYVAPATPPSQQVQAFRNQWECRQNHPLAVRATYLQLIVVVPVVVLAIYMVITLFVGLAAERPVREIDEPPICRACGYNLTGVAADGRCAECGLTLAASFGEEADPGAPWEHRRSTGRVKALAATLGMGFRRPRVLAQQLRLVPPRADYLLLLFAQAVMIGLAIIPVYIAGYTLQGDFRESFATFLMFGMIGCAVVASIGLILICLAALFAGAVQSRIARRNVMGGAAQLAVYTGGHVVLGAWFCGMLMAILVGFSEELNAAGVVGNAPPFQIFYYCMLGWLGVVLLTIASYVVRVTRAASGCRYARR